MFKRRTPAPDPRVDEGLAEIDRWAEWFRAAHAQRLLHEFPDRHLVEDERAKVEALTVAIVAKMREQFLARMSQR